MFSDTARDDVLNLSDLIEGKIDPAKFFDENFKTKGMELLFETAFKRFSGKSDTGVIKLTQAMGGGKTHNMLALDNNCIMFSVLPLVDSNFNFDV